MVERQWNDVISLHKTTDVGFSRKVTFIKKKWRKSLVKAMPYDKHELKKIAMSKKKIQGIFEDLVQVHSQTF